MQLFDESKLVGEATSVKTDSTNCHVRSSEGCHYDQNVVGDDKAEDECSYTAANADAPEEDIAFDLVENHFIEHDTEKEATPSTDESCACAA